LTIITKLEEPGVALDGLRLVIVGPVDTAMVNVKPFEEPALVVLTVTLAVPVVAMRLAGMLAVSCVELTKVVGCSEPFQRIAEVWVKFDPMTVSVKAGPPGAAEDGLIEEITGGGVAEMVKVAAFDVPVPGLLTVTLAVPAVVTRLELTLAVNCVELTNVVGNRLPFHNAADVEMKFDPVMVIVNEPLPGVIVAGLNEVICGPLAAVTGNETVFDVPALGLLTLMLAVVADAIRLEFTVAISCP
jgi:hypothetical protein